MYAKQTLSNVFGVKVYGSSTADSAALGAAVRALVAVANHSSTADSVTFHEFVGHWLDKHLSLLASPELEAHSIYTKMLPAYKLAEEHVMRLASNETNVGSDSDSKK